MIRDRVKAGLANARAKGVRLGAPRTDAKVITRIAREKAKGLSGAPRVERGTRLTVGRGVVQQGWSQRSSRRDLRNPCASERNAGGRPGSGG
jgi:DNA invertase Pin-like site-specific DNA recombinase